MIDRSIIHFGSVPVPYSVLWTGEKRTQTVGICPVVKRKAMLDISDRGNGKPIFGTPHMVRQREVIFHDLCDLCAKSLKLRTKVSLSHAKPIASGAHGLCIMQVEPMVHKECAIVCVEHCPSLKRDIKAGTLMVRQVLKHRTQMALLSGAATEEFAGVREPGAVGHAKVELQRWKDRDLNWLLAG